MFNGHVPYTPLVVDDFTSAPVLAQPTASLAFFLTHYHKDHIRGLTPNFQRGLIYATKVTRALLLQDLPRLRPLLRTVELEEKTQLTLASAGSTDGSKGGGGDAYTFYVTAFDANHCPGAAILLFHLPTTSSHPSAASCTAASRYRALLHTGDMRYDPLRFHSPLLLSAVNHIDTLYLDCTFFHPTAALFPSKAESIRLLIALIGRHFKRHAAQYGDCKSSGLFHPLLHPRVYIAADMLGTEELLLALHSHFTHRMYVARHWDRWRQLALLKRTLPLLASEQCSSPFTVCAARQFQQFKLDMDAQRSKAGGVEALYIKPSAMWFVRLSERRKGGKMQTTVQLKQQSPLLADSMQQQRLKAEEIDVEAEAEAEWGEAVCEDSEWVARDSSGVVHVLWSMHSAMSECLHFIQLMQPRFIVPINPPAALTTATTAGSDGVVDCALTGSDDTALTRKRRSSSLLSTSVAERDRLMVASLQRYIDSLLPHKRIVVRSPVSAAEAEAAAAGEADERAAAEHTVPDTPPPLQGVKRMHSSPCKLESVSETLAAKAKVEVKAESSGDGGTLSSNCSVVAGSSRVSRALFAASSVGGVTRAQSTLLVLREEMDRTCVWQGAATPVVAAETAWVKRIKDETALEDMPYLTQA